MVISLMPNENKNIPENNNIKKVELFFTKNFPQLTRKLFTASRLFSLPR